MLLEAGKRLNYKPHIELEAQWNEGVKDWCELWPCIQVQVAWGEPEFCMPAAQLWNLVFEWCPQVPLSPEKSNWRKSLEGLH